MSAIPVIGNYVNGATFPSKADTFVDVINPATQEVLCRCVFLVHYTYVYDPLMMFQLI